MLAVLKVNGANVLTATDTMFELRLPNDVTTEYQKFRPWYARFFCSPQITCCRCCPKLLRLPRLLALLIVMYHTMAAVIISLCAQ